MKPIAKKILEMGLVTQDMAELMEKWGYLPPGSAERFKEFMEVLPKGDVNKWAEELADELGKEHQVRETNLDLSRLKWPVTLSIKTKEKKQVAYQINGVIDSFGRYYFRIQDVKETWFVPGYKICRDNPGEGIENGTGLQETISEKQILYLDDVPVCLQVTVLKEV